MPAKRAAAVCFLLFVFAGYYKAADLLQPMPVDLTLLFGAATLAFGAVGLWHGRRIPPGTLPMLVVFLAMAMGLHWPEDLGAYPTQKELRLFSLTALSAFAPLILLQEAEQRKMLMYVAILLGVVMAALAVIEVTANGLSPRIGVFNTNPILLARASGFAALILCLLYWQGRINHWAFAIATAVTLLGLLVSGSRGPLAALLLAGILLALLCLFHAPVKVRVWGSVLTGIAGLAAAIFFIESARLQVHRRLFRVLTGEWGDTEIARWAIWQQTVGLIQESPMGIGWGRLTEWVQVTSDEYLLLHPHNIVLEIAAEAGWLASASFLLLIAATAAFSFRKAYTPTGKPTGHNPTDSLFVLIALIYWFLCAMVSGDVNDNRPLWAMLGMALAAHGTRREVQSVDVGKQSERSDTKSGCPEVQARTARFISASGFGRQNFVERG